MTETTELQVFTIPAENIPGLLAKLADLSKKSVKLIGKPINLKMLGEVRKPHVNYYGGKEVPVLDDEGNPCFDIFYEVTIDAETPKINGWSFIATIDHTPTAGNIIRTSPNANCEVPEMYRTAEPMCDHCNKIRSRRDTFLLRCDATGEFKQIGRQCIRDFIGYDVTQVVSLAEIAGSAVPSSSDSEWAGGMQDRRYIRVPTYLAHVAAVMRTVGWISRKDAEYGRGQTTASHALMNMFPPPSSISQYKRIPLIEKDFATAEAALAWAKLLVSKPGASEFDSNMSYLAQEEMIEGRSIGTLAYVVPAYFKATQREFERAERRAALKLGDSQYVGKEGDKIGTKKGQTIAPFEAVLYGYHAIPGDFGTRHIYRFQSLDGNVFIWFASEGPAESLGLGGLDATRRVKVRIVGGTVKRHAEYESVKQTYLTRAKVQVIEECADGTC